jgi:hypothetical protein
VKKDPSKSSARTWPAAKLNPTAEVNRSAPRDAAHLSTCKAVLFIGLVPGSRDHHAQKRSEGTGAGANQDSRRSRTARRVVFRACVPVCCSAPGTRRRSNPFRPRAAGWPGPARIRFDRWPRQPPLASIAAHVLSPPVVVYNSCRSHTRGWL